MRVMSDQNARAFGAFARAFRRSAGTVGSGSFAAGAISSVTISPASAPAASRSFRSTLSQWLFLPSGSSVARKGKPLIVPSTVVMPREGSFALAFLGRLKGPRADLRGRRRLVRRSLGGGGPEEFRSVTNPSGFGHFFHLLEFAFFS